MAAWRDHDVDVLPFHHRGLKLGSWPADWRVALRAPRSVMLRHAKRAPSGHRPINVPTRKIVVTGHNGRTTSAPAMTLTPHPPARWHAARCPSGSNTSSGGVVRHRSIARG